MALQSNYTSYDTPRFRKLSGDQVERLHHASLEILDRTGVRLFEPEALGVAEKERHPSGRWQPRAHPARSGGMGVVRRPQAGCAVQPQRAAGYAAGAQQRILWSWF